MKKIMVIVLIMIIAAGTTVAVLTSRYKGGEIAESLIRLEDYDIPADIGDYGLTIEWLNQSGAKTAFNPKKPVVILFEGCSPAGYKSTYALDSSVYTYSDGVGSIGDNSKDINLNLASYWWNTGYNVGVFHYENYAVGTPNDVVKKIYNSRSISYVNKNGQVVYPSDCEFSLTEVFVYLWLSVLEKTPIIGTETPYASQEIRFIGNSVGANLAISAADYLYAAYDLGLVPAVCVPNRIAVTNPYFSNENLGISIDFREEQHTSPLAYNALRIPELADRGVVFELVESDFDYYTSYAAPYTGIIEGENGIIMGETGDSGLYKTIKANCATLNLSQTYDSYYSAGYMALDRAALDWYLYSINGSDSPDVNNSTYSGHNNTAPMADDIINYVSGRLYALSAWTPTAYIRAVRGVEYRMRTKSYNEATGKYDIETPYTLKKFESEAKQCSNLDRTLVCGYVYLNKNNTKYVNWGADTRLSGVEIILQLELKDSASTKKTFNFTTSRDGFYSFQLEPKYYESAMDISVILPSSLYGYSYDRQIDDSFYQKYSITTINKDNLYLDETYMQKDSNLVQIILNNCGLVLL